MKDYIINNKINGVLKRHETKRSCGHARKKSPQCTSKGNRCCRSPAGESHLSNEKGVDIKVCQKGFCRVYGFGPKRLLVLRRKLQASGTSLEPDKRGKHDNHQTVGENIKDLIREHICSFPTSHSHYSRIDNDGRVYLSPELSISRLYHFFFTVS